MKTALIWRVAPAREKLRAIGMAKTLERKLLFP